MMRPNRRRLVFGLYLIVPVAIAELVSGYLKVPVWPAFVALVLFFIEHMNVKRVPAILIGALVGLALATPNPNPYLWTVVAAVGGALLIAGAVLIEKMVGLHAPQTELNLPR
jgi:drug/metabolite transporter (DMT)-like permease